MTAPTDAAGRGTDAGQGDEAPLPPLGSVGLLRWAWRQLTSMRTALVLLFLLAVASIPGSVLPQRGTNPLRVSQWLQDNPATGPVLDRLGFFDVYASPWFAAVYLLLFVSLVGCVLPRARQHWRAVRTPPPPAPRRLERLPQAVEFESDVEPADVLALARAALGGWRRRESPPEAGWLAAEKGYSREVGNLVFHMSLVALLVGVAVGGLFGWKGNVIVREGEGFSNTLTQYDAWGGGRMVQADGLAPFSFTLDRFTVDFERGEAQRGAPRVFVADVTYRDEPTSTGSRTTIEVNEPLAVDGAKVFLVGHGYAPHFVIRDATGAVVFDDSVVFLPQDGNFTSTGVIKVPDAEPALGISGLFLPTAALDDVRGPHSTFPAPDFPAVFLSAFTGDLGMDSGVPQSVYTLDTSQMDQLGLESLLPGDTWSLPDGAGTVEFTGFERWASFQIASDPGKELVLASALVAIAGLLVSLFVRRRRIWVKALPREGGGSLVQVAGLSKAEDAGLADEVARVASRLGWPATMDAPRADRRTT
ncbi:MAG: cytochrome c biogenesis protein ResB [Actinomycetota bacterium]|nr:cytochrome c biogenesis protein ResB [Actinomycetota bacterium]